MSHGEMRSLLHPHRCLPLDVLIAAVLMTVPGLTLSIFIQALTLNWPALLPTFAEGSMDCRSVFFNACCKDGDELSS